MGVVTRRGNNNITATHPPFFVESVKIIKREREGGVGWRERETVT
jgi:hypothetical protein